MDMANNLKEEQLTVLWLKQAQATPIILST